MSETKEKANTGYECRFAVYVDPPEQNGKDLHLVKLTKHNEDGTRTPEVKLVYDYQRPFWISNKGSRNYSQHKEWEDKTNLIEFKSTQSKLLSNVSKAIGYPGFRGTLKQLCESPYIYGVEILSTAVLKKALMDRYPTLQTTYTIAVSDTETDVVKGTKEIVMMSVTSGSTVFTAVTKDFLEGEVNVQNRFDTAIEKYLGDIPDVGNIIKLRNLKCELVIVDNALEVIRAVANKSHELKPDFLAFWNIDFDMTKMLEVFEKYHEDPKNIFSDPIVPKNYRLFKYIRGPKQKKTASGLVTPIKPAAQWHTVKSTSSFYFIDAMCCFKHIRTGKQEEQSYALDAILKRNKLGGKLKFKEAEHLEKLEWHQFMQSRFKIEYIIYNIWDCISIEMLDEKTSDLRLTLPLFSGFSDFENFKSQPRRVVDKLHYFCLEQGKVIGTTPPKGNKGNKGNSFSDDEDDDDNTEASMSDEDMDKMTLGLEGWIITLPAHQVMDNGLKCIKEYPELRTNIHIQVGDLDVSASYPNGGAVFNVSKETTRCEMNKIIGVEEYTQRMQGINLTTAGHVNAVEYCQNMFNFPSLVKLLDNFNTIQNK